ncbi:unnamed protein product, partial [Gadus morhua 'NCC']
DLWRGVRVQTASWGVLRLAEGTPNLEPGAPSTWSLVPPLPGAWCPLYLEPGAPSTWSPVPPLPGARCPLYLEPGAPSTWSPVPPLLGARCPLYLEPGASPPCCSRHVPPPPFAINSRPGRRMTVKEIYTWIEDRFPFFQQQTKPSWKSSIHHNLSTHD